MMMPALSVHAIASAIACLCSSANNDFFHFDGKQNLTEPQNVHLLQLEGQLIQIEQKQSAMLWLLAENFAILSSNFRNVSDGNSFTQPSMTSMLALQTVISTIACGGQFKGQQNLNPQHIAESADGFGAIREKLTQFEEKQAAMLQLMEINFASLLKAANVVDINQNKDTAEIQRIYVGLHSFEVLRIHNIQHGADWIVIQQRFNGSLDFNRNWNEYKHGFGTLDGEFFMGLEKLYLLTHNYEHELLITMEDFENQTRYAHYDEFIVASEIEKYAIQKVGKYRGDAGDSFSGHKNLMFSTFDNDNDWELDVNCAQKFKGGWWYGMLLHESNLNGEYFSGKNLSNTFGDGIIWTRFHGLDYSLKAVRMAIRRKLT